MPLMIRRLILGFALVAPLATILIWRHSIPLAIGVLFASHMLILYPTLSPNSRWLGSVVSRFATNRREVWLTIDDGPDPDDTEAILDLLDEFAARATFFVKGKSAETYPDLLQAIADRGHSLGNHSFTHPLGSFWCLPPASIAREIDLASDAIERISGTRPTLFRAPVGHKNPFVHALLDERGMTLVGWSARGWDTVSSPAVAATRVMRGVKPGSIVLLHQGTGDSSDSESLSCIRQVLRRLADEGYRCVIPTREQLIE